MDRFERTHAPSSRRLIWRGALFMAFAVSASALAWLFRPAPRPTPVPAAPQPPVPDPSPEAGLVYDQGQSLLAQGKPEEALAAFRKAGEMGHGRAWLQAGLLLMEGPPGLRNTAEAADALGRSLEASSGRLPEAAWKLAWLYEQGSGVPKDLDFSRQLRDFALSLSPYEMDDLSKGYLLGLYEAGRTGRVDVGRVMALYETLDVGHGRAGVFLARAAATDPEAAYRLGQARLHGKLGLDPDPAQAAEDFRRAAEAGHAAAWRELAELYEEGKGVAKDPAEALVCRRHAAESADPDPRSLVVWAKALRAQDSGRAEEAFRLLERAHELAPGMAAGVLADALELGYGTRQDSLRAACLYAEAGEPGRGRSLLLKAIQARTPGALGALGRLELFQGAWKDAEPALRGAIKEGDEQAARLLGRVLSGFEPISDGEGPREDPQEAWRLLLRAARKKVPGAALDLCSLGARLGPDLDEGQARALEQVLREGAEDPRLRMGLVQRLVARGDATSLKQATLLAESLIELPARSWRESDTEEALVDLGRAWVEGKAVGPDPVKALRFFRVGAGLDLPGAWMGLADLYDGGRGVSRDPVRARYCRARASFRDDQGGC